jgi:hypothetical protein
MLQRMRTAVVSVVAIVTVLLAGALVVMLRAPLPLPRVDLGVEEACMNAMERPPEMTWVMPDRQARMRGVEPEAVPLAVLPTRGGHLVRVAGYLHVDFEWVALYPSREAMERRQQAPSVTLDAFWPDEPYWKTQGPSISGRCAVVEGWYERVSGGSVNIHGRLEPLRLEVWSTPHRPIDTSVPAPPPREP